MQNDTTRPVLYFDGVCNLCSGMVKFVIRNDKKEQFLFAPLQSPAGTEALQHAPDANEKTGSFILYSNGRYYTRSSAALHTFRLLGGIWQLLYAAIVVPQFIRDGVYMFISRNRYKWFGKSESCMVPTKELMARFVG